MSKLNLAFIGCGFVAQQCHLPCYSSIDFVNIHTLCDPVEDLRNKLAKKYSAENQYNSHLEIDNLQEIDAFVVTLPRKLSFNVLDYLIKLKKPIFTEKPLCLDYKNAKALEELAIKYETYIKVGYMKSNDGSIEKLKEIINELKKNNEVIKLINSYSFMGDSYCSPFGDSKGKFIPSIVLKEESMPYWLNKDNYYAYEQFINVFSHISHIIEYIFQEKVNLISAKISELGEGILLCDIDKIPLSISLCRGQQNEWDEGIDIKYGNKKVSIKFPPPFLRNVPGIIEIESGEKDNTKTVIRTNWSWAFRNQAVDFCEKVRGKYLEFDELRSAIRQIDFAEKIFREYIK